jgi:poly(3-hydroxybutyrate) depolymerase
VGDCDYDAAGAILQYLYSGIETPALVPVTELQPVELPGATDAGLSETAYLFVPPACADGEQTCALHLVLHGCAQSAVQVGTDFIQQSGYLSWAEANDIVLAFPQVVPGALNPYACWDWWGYTGADYLYRKGKQMQVVTDWIKQLAAARD